MVVLRPREAARRWRGVLAASLAVGVHLLVLTALGWRIPRVAGRETADDDTPPLEVTLVRPRAAPSAAPEAAPRRPPSSPAAAARVLTAPTPGAPTLSAPEQAPPPASAQRGPRDCTPEDRLLLTDAEKALCQNEIGAERARRLARASDERIARQLAQTGGMAPTYRMDADKQADFDAQAARASAPMPREPATVGHGIGVGVACRHVQIPILGGVEANPNLFAKTHKQEHPSHGPGRCSVAIGGVP